MRIRHAKEARDLAGTGGCQFVLLASIGVPVKMQWIPRPHVQRFVTKLALDLETLWAALGALDDLLSHSFVVVVVPSSLPPLALAELLCLLRR